MKNINDMDTKAILWYLVYRHRVFLLILSNLLTVTFYTVRHFDTAWANLVN